MRMLGICGQGIAGLEPTAGKNPCFSSLHLEHLERPGEKCG